MLGGVGKERQVARPLDRVRERALVLGAGAGLASRLDASTIRNESAEEVDVLVVDNLDLVRAHDAYPAAAAHPASGALIVRRPASWAGAARAFGGRAVKATRRRRRSDIL